MLVQGQDLDFSCAGSRERGFEARFVEFCPSRRGTVFLGEVQGGEISPLEALDEECLDSALNWSKSTLAPCFIELWLGILVFPMVCDNPDLLLSERNRYSGPIHCILSEFP